MGTETQMYEKGAKRIMRELLTSKGNPQKVSSMQTAQQIIVKEASLMTPLLSRWIQCDSAKRFRKRYSEVFVNEEAIEFYTISVMFLLIKNMYVIDKGTKRDASIHKLRHSHISTINNILFDGQLEFDLLWRFIEQIIENCQFLDKESWCVYESMTPKIFQTYTCSLADDIKYMLSLKAVEAFYPLPMNSVPIDWIYCDGLLVGGYETYQFGLIRRSSKENVDYTKYPQNIFDAVNYIQSVPWRINEIVLEALERDLEQPQKKDYVKSIFPDKEGIDFVSPTDQLTSDQLREREAFYSSMEIYYAEVNDLESAIGKWRATRIAIDIAKNHVGEVIYFPHNYDFRGRIYPIAIGLSPQGSDSVKAMLEFSKGQKLDSIGEAWCWAYLATLYGEDKLPFKQRVEKGKTLLHKDYKEADEPYQFLAHQIELQRWVLDTSYEVKTRIHLDACNSGSQFTSAITGDKKGCLATNVIPHPEGKREDAYQQVADTAINSLLLRESELDDVDSFTLSLLQKEGRKICKKPVMVSNYGGTSGGRIDILYNCLRELGVDRRWVDKKVASRMSTLIGNAIEGVLVGGKAFERYIQKISTIIASHNVSITWNTPDGFQVVYSKFDKKIITHKCLLDGKSTFINQSISSDNISARQMKNSASPNYIHSLDATLLRRVALRLRKMKIMNSSWIHDSFGCPPNDVDTMLDITKKEFIKLIRSTPLLSLDDELKYQASKLGEKESSLGKIKAPQLRGFRYSTGLNDLMESEWFFS